VNDVLARAYLEGGLVLGALGCERTARAQSLPDLVHSGLVVHDQPSGSSCIQRRPTVELCVSNRGEASAGPLTAAYGFLDTAPNVEC